MHSTDIKKIKISLIQQKKRYMSTLLLHKNMLQTFSRSIITKFMQILLLLELTESSVDDDDYAESLFSKKLTVPGNILERPFGFWSN